MRREDMAVTDEPLGFLIGGKVAAENLKPLAMGSRDAHASNPAKRGAASFVLVPAEASLGQPPGRYGHGFLLAQQRGTDLHDLA